jgi:phosphatidylserine/phosphatidylglycerophosphate/cardiolipin synthase-like enzyme
MVVSFLIGGHHIRKALERAVRRLHGHVYVVTALDDRAIAKSIGEDIDKGELRRNIKRFDALTTSGVYVRGTDACHAKFCLVDDRYALVGSANFDQSGLGFDRNFQPGEVGLVTDDFMRVDALKRLFRHLWLHGCTHEALPDKTDYVVKPVRRPKPPSVEAPPAKNRAPIWTGFGSRGILKHLQALIASARKQLILSTYSFHAMQEHPELIIEPVLEARKRGVAVDLFMRNRARDLPQLSRLVEVGVRVRADGHNHAKYVIADGKQAALFSANLDGQHGLTSGVETGLRLDGDETREMLAYHHAVWEGAVNQVRFLREPRDLEALLKGIQKDCPFGKSVRLKGEPDACIQAEEIARGPCLIVLDNKGNHLFLGPESSVFLTKTKDGPDWRVEPTEQRRDQFSVCRQLAMPDGSQALGIWLPLDAQFSIK